jgi:hypothetical protein
MPCVKRHAAEELALRAAVAFAEGMDGVDLAKIVAGAPREGFGVEALQMPLCLQRGEERFERRQNELRRWEAEGIGARGGDLAEVASLREDVLEDMAVDEPKVSDVEAPDDRLVFKLGYAEEREPSNVSLELVGICDAEFVAQNPVSIIEVAVKENASQGL